MAPPDEVAEAVLKLANGIWNLVDKVDLNEETADQALKVDALARGLAEMDLERIRDAVAPRLEAGVIPDCERLRTRDIFSCALALCVASSHGLQVDNLDDRLGKLLRVADRAQKHNGHLWWFWDERRTGSQIHDPNAVEFCMRGACQLWLHFAEESAAHDAPLIRGESQEILKRIMQRAAAACRKHRVPESYTNIALMNAMNLMLIGKCLKDQDLRQQGEHRFDQFCIYTWEWGIHEYNSPTYTAVQMSCLGLIQRYADSEDAKRQAGDILDLLWDYVAADWIETDDGGRLGGVHSRVDDQFIHADGNIDDIMWAIGRVSERPRDLNITIVYHYLLHDLHSASARNALGKKTPGTERRRWGPEKTQCVTMHRQDGVWLSTAGSSFNGSTRMATGRSILLSQDVPLAVDFTQCLGPSQYTLPPPYRMGLEAAESGSPGCLPRCIFLPDHDDPNGQEDRNEPYSTHKTHYKPMWWAASQDRTRALGVVLYKKPHLNHVESHFIFPRDLDGFWIGQANRPIALGRNDLDIPAMPYAGCGPVYEPLFLRKGEAFVGVQVVWLHHPERWERSVDKPVRLLCRSRDMRYNAARLTVDHGATGHAWTQSGGGGNAALRYADVAFGGLALWVETGTGDDAAFKKWRKAFLATEFTVETNHPNHLKIQAQWTGQKKGDTGDLHVELERRDLRGRRFTTSLKPEPTLRLREVIRNRDSGRDRLTRDIWSRYSGTPTDLNQKADLKSIDPGPLTLSALKDEAHPPMRKFDDPEAYYGDYVSMSKEDAIRGVRGSDVGSIRWRFVVPRAGNYYLWGYVKTPSRDSDSYFLSVDDEKGVRQDLGIWVVGTRKSWGWAPVGLSEAPKSGTPSAVYLPKGVVSVRLFAREWGTQIDRIFITSNPLETPLFNT